MNAGIGKALTPFGELGIEIIQIAECASKKEILTDVAKWALDLAFGFCPVWLASIRLSAIMIQKSDKRWIKANSAIWILSQYGCLHAIIQHLQCGTAESFKGCNMTAQDHFQFLIGTIASPHKPRITKDNRKQKDFARHARFTGELHLCLLAGCCLKALFERACRSWAKLAKILSYSGVTAFKSQGLYLTV
ncbi:hypothetical protein PsAD37_01197 [Pseudovibrio sp. Ad37]|nr:hypothetical protein PsAD37_01197 [Pseudovibrio sp. Ad37]